MATEKTSIANDNEKIFLSGSKVREMLIFFWKTTSNHGIRYPGLVVLILKKNWMNIFIDTWYLFLNIR